MTNRAKVSESDCVQQFHLTSAPIRGRAGRLSETLQQLLAIRNDPPAVKSIIAETAVLTALIGQLIHPGWKLSIQVRSRGPLRLIAADYFAPENPRMAAKLRSMATYDESFMKSVTSVPSFDQHEGYFAVLMDRNDGKKPVHGMVPLERPTLAQCAEDYFRRSEQIPTRFVISVGQFTAGARKIWRGGGIVIQQLPDAENVQHLDDWARSETLLSTVAPFELTGPSVSMLQTLHRLFHEEQPKVGSIHSVEFGCSCSAEKVRQSLSIYSSKDIATMTTAEGMVTADCQFCGHRYEFDPSSLGFEAAVGGGSCVH